MPTVKEVRELVDGNLDRWQATASALEASAQANIAAVTERVQVAKDKAAEASEGLKQAVTRAQQLPSEARDKIIADVDHLKVQLALGKVEAYDAAMEQKQMITQAVQRVETQIDQFDGQIDDAVNKAVANWVRADQQLSQEIELAEVRFQHEKEKRQAQFEDNKQIFVDRAKQFRAMVEENASAAQQKGSAFADNMKASFEQAVATFRNLSK